MKKICNKFGCNNLINLKDKYCDAHKNELEEQLKKWRKDYDIKRRNDRYRKFYKSNQWSIIRNYVLKRDNYLCRECIKAGKVTICSTVHHIIEIKSDFSKALDTDNLITLCHECHNKIHKRFIPPTVKKF